jgi:hypothetical protein
MNYLRTWFALLLILVPLQQRKFVSNAEELNTDDQHREVLSSGISPSDRARDLSQDNTYIEPHLLPAKKIALLQFDSRPLRNYWLTAAAWNAHYCKLHGHQFLYYSIAQDDHCHYGNEPLASAWCKVRAMMNAYEDFSDIDMFIYLDSDAVIDQRFASKPLNSILFTMQKELSWKYTEKPIIFNQDGPCWWCTFIMKIGYTMCLNAGTVAFYRHPNSWKILSEWWDSSMDSYETNPIKRKFRLKWPWEQDRQMAIYNRSSQYIQVASQPNKVFMNLKAGHTDGWCLSHLPEAGCFFSHYCANSHSKQVMRKIYDNLLSANESTEVDTIKNRYFSTYKICIFLFLTQKCYFSLDSMYHAW